MSADTALDELPTLTSKQTVFVNGLIEGKTATDAYMAAYDCRGMSKRSIWVEASRLRANTKIALWLRHYQRIGRDTARITVETHLAELARTRELALAHGQIAAGVHAEHCRGKVVGLYEKSVGFADTVSDIELLHAIETMLGGDTAQAISAALKGDQ